MNNKYGYIKFLEKAFCRSEKYALKHYKHAMFLFYRCNYEATQRSHLKRHMETHDVIKRYACQHCDYSANTVGYMKIHYTRSHKGEQFVYKEADVSALKSESQLYRCLSCDYLFGNLSDLKRHLKIRHHLQFQQIQGIDQNSSEVQVRYVNYIHVLR